MNKRFKYGRAFPINSDDSLPVITDNENDKDYFRMLDLVDLLNEQQDTIFELQDLCGKSNGENAKLRIENKRLKEENEKLSEKNRRLIYHMNKEPKR